MTPNTDKDFYLVRNLNLPQRPEKTGQHRNKTTAGIVGANVLIAILLPLMFRSQYPGHPESFGAAWGPSVLSGEWWRLLTSLFVHIRVMHLAANMTVLWFAGSVLEAEIGGWRLLAYYLFSGVVGGLVPLAINPYAGAYGASACVSGVLGALLVKCITNLRRTWTSSPRRVLLLGAGTLYIFVLDTLRDNRYSHISGFLIGVVLMLLFQTIAGPLWREACLAVLLALALICGLLFLMSRWQNRVIQGSSRNHLFAEWAGGPGIPSVFCAPGLPPAGGR